MIGAHTVLTTYYWQSHSDASRLLNVLDAGRGHRHGEMSRDLVRDGFLRADDANVDGWDGCHAAVAAPEGMDTVVTIDDDFEQFEQFEQFNTEVVLSPEQFRELPRYPGD